MELSTEEKKVLNYCSKEILYLERLPNMGIGEERMKHIIRSLEKQGLIYKDKINPKLTAVCTTLKGDKALQS